MCDIELIDEIFDSHFIKVEEEAVEEVGNKIAAVGN